MHSLLLAQFLGCGLSRVNPTNGGARAEANGSDGREGDETECTMDGVRRLCRRGWQGWIVGIGVGVGWCELDRQFDV